MMSMDWVGDQLARLQAEFPDWDIWYVRHVVERGGLWCFKPKGEPIATGHADSVDGLREALLGRESPVTGKLFSVRFPRQDDSQLWCEESHTSHMSV